MRGEPRSTRQRVHGLSGWLVGVLLVVASVAGYASSQLLDEDAFAELIARSLDEPEVRELLANKAVDIALDAADADALLADALPEELSLVATPALELSKPAIAEAGATLLGVEAVGDSLEAAARSAHRQTTSAVLAREETNVQLNLLPILVVVADEIAGDAGARAVLSIELTDSTTQIDLGSNDDPLWAAVRGLGVVSASLYALWLLTIVAFFASAPVGERLRAARHVGKLFLKVGFALLLIGWVVAVAVAVVLEIALSPGEALSVGGLSFGGVSDGGGIALASVLLGPLWSTARSTMITGLVVILASRLLGSSPLAVAVRQAARTRNSAPLIEVLRNLLPHHVRHTQMVLSAGLVVVLLAWPDITLRAVLTLTGLAGAGLLALWTVSGRQPLAARMRELFGAETVEDLSVTPRSERGAVLRRRLGVGGFVLALVWPSYSVSSLVSLLVVVFGLAAWSYRWELRRPKNAAEAPAELVEEDPTWTPRKRLAAFAAAAVAAFVLLVGGGDSNPVSAAGLDASEAVRCNGLSELCDVALDEVAFAGTHNSMSSSDLGWEFANHGAAIPAQLDGGIRALLIDVLLWEDGESLDELALDPEAVAIASSALAGADPPENGLWMCHQLCGLGATPFVDFLADLRAFLETNPDEVVIVVVQDVAPADDITQAIEESGLVEFALSHETGTPWPTLGEMITNGTRVVFLAENEADGAGWYQRAFDGNVSETDFSYAVVEDFECASNRGGDAAGSLFMINHWVETGLPIPSEADQVNSREVLLDRVAECSNVRGRTPGIIAVNFWERGDLLAVVDELNLADR